MPDKLAFDGAPRISTGKVVSLAIHVIRQGEVSFGRLTARIDARD